MNLALVPRLKSVLPSRDREGAGAGARFLDYSPHRRLAGRFVAGDVDIPSISSTLPSRLLNSSPIDFRCVRSTSIVSLSQSKGGHPTLCSYAYQRLLRVAVVASDRRFHRMPRTPAGRSNAAAVPTSRGAAFDLPAPSGPAIGINPGVLRVWDPKYICRRSRTVIHRRAHGVRR